MKRGIGTIVFCAAVAAFSSACMTNLHSNSLRIGVLNAEYSDGFYVEDNTWSWNDGTAMLVSSGSLPPGIQLTGNGQLIGTPTMVGDFSFSVTAYTFDNDWWDSDDDVYEDSEWYTLFVTEASTNGSCPSPDDESASEIFACLGALEKDNLEADETFELDVNYFIDFTQGYSYDVSTLDFSVIYDDANFTPVESSLNSQILREAALRTDASVSFDTSVPGELRVVVSARSQNLHKSGRLIDLPFAALQDVAAGTYPFTVVWNGIGQNSTKHALPSAVEIDGSVEVTDGVYDEALVSESADEAAPGEDAGDASEEETLEETADETADEI